jgi:superfamily I DNA/RNA helicase
MSDKDQKKCQRPTIIFVDGDERITSVAAEKAVHLRAKNYPRVGIVAFSVELIEMIAQWFSGKAGEGRLLKERGDSIAAKPLPGIFIMSAENCGGLEFDAVILAGVDHGRVPPSLHNISAEGHMSAREESCKELYTAITRARYYVSFVCDQRHGASEFVTPWVESDVIREE